MSDFHDGIWKNENFWFQKADDYFLDSNGKMDFPAQDDPPRILVPEYTLGK
jgi:hypothetical protein